MTDAGFFRGTSTDQDVRFSDKDKKLLKTMKFEECLEQKVDMHKVNFEALKPWVSEQVTKILGIEDEVVVELIFSFLEHDQFPSPKKLQILVTGFLQSKPARIFIGQLWGLLLSAQENPSKLPEKFIEDKKNAIRQQKKLIEKELSTHDNPRRYSPDRDEYYRRPHHGRYRGSSRSRSRSPHWRTSERREKGIPSDFGTQVQKSEASSTQTDLEQPGPTSASTLSRVENMIKSVEQVMHQSKAADPKREIHKERSRSRSRSHSPSRRNRSRSRERGDSRERRHRIRRLSPSHRTHRPSFSPYSPDSHFHHQRGRGHERESPHHSRPLRSPENRHRQEPPISQHKHTELHYQGHIEKHRPPHNEVRDRSDRKEHHHLPTQDTMKTRHPRHQKPEQEFNPIKKRSPQVHKEARTGRDAKGHEGRGRKVSNTSSSPSSSSTSSGSVSPAKERVNRGREEGRNRKKSSTSTSGSSESNFDSRHRHRQAPAKQRTQAKPSGKVKREMERAPRKEPMRESSKRGSVQTKRKSQQNRSSHHHRMNSPSDRSGHTSDDFSELEQKRKSLLRLKKQKLPIATKRKSQRERYNVPVRSKIRRPQKKRRESVDRRVVVSKRRHATQRLPSSDISDESEDNSELEEALSRNALKRREKQTSPASAKRPRHKRSLTLDSSSVSSDSDDSSSSESDSDEQQRRRDKRKERGTGKERKRTLDSGDSSGNDSPVREKGRSSLEKHLRGKLIQSMSKKRQRKSKN